MSSKATEIAKNLPTLEHPDGSPIRALVVDDEEMLKELVSMALKMIGWEVQSAGDGPSALNIARDWRPDVLVLDIMMPGFDGLELLNRIRKFYPEVPCLFLTAKDSVDNRIEGLAAGERVVLEGMDRLRNGSAVKIVAATEGDPDALLAPGPGEGPAGGPPPGP